MLVSSNFGVQVHVLSTLLAILLCAYLFKAAIVLAICTSHILLSIFVNYSKNDREVDNRGQRKSMYVAMVGLARPWPVKPFIIQEGLVLGSCWK